MFSLWAGTGLAVAATTGPTLRLPLRVHILESPVRELGASAAIDAATVRERLRTVNQAFAPAGIEWVIEEIRVEAPAAVEPFLRAVAGEKPLPSSAPRAEPLPSSAPRAEPPGVLKSLVSPAGRRSPDGFDLYVVRQLNALGFGGAYVCSIDGEPGHGAAFIAVEEPSRQPSAPLAEPLRSSAPRAEPRARPLAVRKWAHELGHSLGLPHTACEPGDADRLMMSGKCSYAQAGRVRLTDEEIARIREQALVGGPARCRKHADDDAE